MVLSDEQIVSFQALYKSQFGKEISRDEAIAKGITLLRLVQLIYKPMSKGDHQKLQERRKATSNL